MKKFVSALGLACFGGAAVLQAFTAQRNAIFPTLCEAKCRSVHLASTVSTRLLPTTVLVHGLDSSKETWAGTLSTLSKLGYPAIALDLRGHGESPLGAVDDFTPENLARDVLGAVKAHGIRGPYVLVGHSMGGRIAMRMAAIEVEEFDRCGKAPQLAACIIEDMDVRIRDGPKPPDDLLDAKAQNQIKSFLSENGRLFTSWELCRSALLPCNVQHI